MRLVHSGSPCRDERVAPKGRLTDTPGPHRHSFRASSDRQCGLGRPAGIYGDWRRGEHLGRLEALNKECHTQILASGEVAARVRGRLDLVNKGRVALKGRVG